jgi:hypothetical protein
MKSKHTFVFVGGLHRSGTTMVADCLRMHPEVSGFHDTPNKHNMDEGQQLQTVYLPDDKLGGPGRYAFRRAGRLTETSSLVTEANRKKIFEELSRYWDLSKPILMEKTPSTITRTRFMQALFPDSRFIIIRRHPVAATCATMKWKRIPVFLVMLHWFYCYGIMQRDKAFLRKCIFLTYEEFCNNPRAELEKIFSFMGLEWDDSVELPAINTELNRKYFNQWNKLPVPYRFIMELLFEKHANKYGYSIKSLDE